MMVFMSKKMVKAAAEEQAKRDKIAKTTRNLSIAAVAIGGVNLVRGVVGNISAKRDLKAIKDKVLTWDEYFGETYAKDEEEEVQQPVVAAPKQEQQPVVVDPNQQQQPVVVDPKQQQQQQ